MAAGSRPTSTSRPPAHDPWAMFLNQRGLFTSFASEFLTTHGRITEQFEPDAQTLEAFRAFLTRQRFAPRRNSGSPTRTI